MTLGDVYDAPALVGEDHQNEQQAARRGRHHEEIRGHDLSDVIRQELAMGDRVVIIGSPEAARAPPATELRLGYKIDTLAAVMFLMVSYSLRESLCRSRSRKRTSMI